MQDCIEVIQTMYDNYSGAVRWRATVGIWRGGEITGVTQHPSFAAFFVAFALTLLQGNKLRI